MLKQFFLAAVIAGAIPSATLAEGQGNITVNVKGLRNSQGVVRVALFNSAGAYDKSKGSEDNARGAFKKEAASINSQNATCTFSGVPYGEYAIKMFHDEANSGKFATGLFGIPKVEYGFSNNVLGKMGPAPCDKAKFNLQQPNLTIEINAHSGI